MASMAAFQGTFKFYPCKKHHITILRLTFRRCVSPFLAFVQKHQLMFVRLILFNIRLASGPYVLAVCPTVSSPTPRRQLMCKTRIITGTETTSVGEVTTSVGEVMTSVGEVMTSVVEVMTSVVEVMASVGEVMTYIQMNKSTGAMLTGALQVCPQSFK